ncbi:MAG: alpha/beta hydrolase, partial [Planctomycetaceae bacterium]|nr:alpha/beta hydrolase [Planctomycetaceae bacterium]
MQSPICHGLTLMITVLLSAAVNAQPAYPPSFEGATEVVYRTVGDTELKMWIFVPEQHDAAKDVRPTAVFFFGGGWRAGTPAQFESHCRYLASRGMVAATADYRVETRHGVKAVSCVEDAAEAVRWLRQNAKGLGIDPQR